MSFGFLCFKEFVECFLLRILIDDFDEILKSLCGVQALLSPQSLALLFLLEGDGKRIPQFRKQLADREKYSSLTPYGLA